MNTSGIMAYNPNRRIHPVKFALWLGMASIVMMFGALTSAYLVKQAAGNWLEYKMPAVFYWNTAVILLSSVMLHSSYRAYLKGNERLYKMGLLLSFALGITFVVLQYIGWSQLFNVGVDLKQNVSGSFLYLITGVHALHVLGGIAALFVATFHAFTLKYRVSEKRKNRFELVLHYWHFVDVLWVYLFIFLLISK